MTEATPPPHSNEEPAAAQVAARKLPQRRTGLSQVFQARLGDAPESDPASEIAATSPDSTTVDPISRLAPASRLGAFDHHSTRPKLVSPQEWLAPFTHADNQDHPAEPTATSADSAADQTSPESESAEANSVPRAPTTLGSETPAAPELGTPTPDVEPTESTPAKPTKTQTPDVEPTPDVERVVVLPESTDHATLDTRPITIVAADQPDQIIDLRDAPSEETPNLITGPPTPAVTPDLTAPETPEAAEPTHTAHPLPAIIVGGPTAATTAQAAVTAPVQVPANELPSDQLLPSPSVILAYPQPTETHTQDLLPPPGQIQPRPVPTTPAPQVRPRAHFQPVTWAQAQAQAEAGLTEQAATHQPGTTTPASAGYLLPAVISVPDSAEEPLPDVRPTDHLHKPDPQIRTGEYLQPISEPQTTIAPDAPTAPVTAPTTNQTPTAVSHNTNQPLLELVGIKAKRGRERVLGGIDLTITTGQIHAIIGPRNSGKSTLLRICGGLLRPYSGRVLIDQRRIHGPLHVPLAQAGIVTVSPDSLALPTLTVRENLGLAPVAGINAEYVAEEVFARFPHLRAHADRTVGDLETVDHIILAFAKALLNRPRLLIVDDIAPAMSDYNHQVLSQVVREIAASGTALLVANKDPFAVLAFSAHATVIQGGRSVYTGTASEVTEVLHNRGVTAPA